MYLKVILYKNKINIHIKIISERADEVQIFNAKARKFKDKNLKMGSKVDEAKLSSRFP